MANEITLSASLNLQRTSSTINFISGSISTNQAGDKGFDSTQDVGTSPQTIGGIYSGMGYIVVQNVDTNPGNLLYILQSMTGFTGSYSGGLAQLGQLDVGELVMFKLSSDFQNPQLAFLSTASSARIVVLAL